MCGTDRSGGLRRDSGVSIWWSIKWRCSVCRELKEETRAATGHRWKERKTTQQLRQIRLSQTIFKIWVRAQAITPPLPPPPSTSLTLHQAPSAPHFSIPRSLALPSLSPHQSSQWLYPASRLHFIQVRGGRLTLTEGQHQHYGCPRRVSSHCRTLQMESVPQFVKTTVSTLNNSSF